MTDITISISDDRMQKLREKASRFQVAPEELVRVSLEDLIARPEEDFRQALAYVLNQKTLSAACLNARASVDEQVEIVLQVASSALLRESFTDWLCRSIKQKQS